MTKYERALIRPGLRTALCVPIFADAEAWRVADPSQRPAPIGIVALDSDEDLGIEFAETSLLSFFATQAVLFSASFGK